MSNPSLKNGYLSIAIELVEQFASHNIPGNEMRILWTVMRKTWGWTVGDRKKDWDIISLTQFEKFTEMNRRNVSRSIKSLVAKRLLLKRLSYYKINQYYNEWVVAKRLLVSNVVAGRGKRGSKVGVKRLHTIDNTIDNIQKKAEELFKPLWEIYPRKRGRNKALSAFKAFLKKGKDVGRLKQAIENYKKDIGSKSTEEQFIQYGSTFFNNWEEWENYKPSQSGMRYPG